MEESIFVGEGL
jgi:hypothetical protein